jgi:hypothetical protein
VAIIYAVKQYRHYLLGRLFIIRTDHAALQWLKRTPTPVGQQSRQLEILEEYDYAVVHRPKAKHGNADALSRIPCRQCGYFGSDGDELIFAARSLKATDADLPEWNMDALVQAQQCDSDIGPVYGRRQIGGDAPETESLSHMSGATKSYFAEWATLELKSD